MFFRIKPNKFLSPNQLKTDTLLHAYHIINNYSLNASDIILDNYLQQQYNDNLKNLCVKLLLNITFFKDEEENIILMFKDPSLDRLAQLITYGNGAIYGSRILQIALHTF